MNVWKEATGLKLSPVAVCIALDFTDAARVVQFSTFIPDEDKSSGDVLHR